MKTTPNPKFSPTRPMTDPRHFSISGYFKDDQTPFFNYTVSESKRIGRDDNEIFFYGLSESDLKEAVLNGSDNGFDFVITEYELIN